MYKLIIQDDEGKTTVVPLIREELTIGRQEGNTIRLTERNVSRKHAKLLRGTEEIIIEDLDSYNGVRVNGSRIQGRAEIKEADRVQIGDYLIEVKADQPNADAETREIAVIAESEVPSAIGVSASEAATAPTSIPVSTPPPVPAPAPAPAIKANGTGPNLTTEATAAIVSPDEHASGRLVILSKTMAGREFVLDKPAMVIGRTEENDIWVNHRSISRHHAKVVRENGNYAIVDLQSANGVRVNGEEYGKVELRTRDVVDLGHVRFRFVAPNEDFLFGRDAQPVDIATEGQSSKMLWAAVGLLLLGVVAFLLLSGDKKEGDSNSGVDTSTKAVIDDPPIIDDPPPLPVVTDASVGSTANSANDKQIATFLSQANAAETGENWGALAQAANKILALDPANTNAKAMIAKAELEKKSQTSYGNFKTSLAKKPKKYVLAASAFDEIDEASVYKGQAEELHEQAKEEFSAGQKVEAQKAVALKGKPCKDALDIIIRNVPKEWGSVSTGIRANYKCKDVSRPTNNTTANNNKPPPPPPPKDLGPPIEELVSQAEDAVKNTQYGKGSRLCRQALERDPNNQRAITACAIASCNLKNGSAAKKYVRRIKSSQRRQGLKQICLRLGVTGFDD